MRRWKHKGQRSCRKDSRSDMFPAMYFASAPRSRHIDFDAEVAEVMDNSHRVLLRPQWDVLEYRIKGEM